MRAEYTAGTNQRCSSATRRVISTGGRVARRRHHRSATDSRPHYATFGRSLIGNRRSTTSPWRPIGRRSGRRPVERDTPHGERRLSRLPVSVTDGLSADLRSTRDRRSLDSRGRGHRFRFRSLADWLSALRRRTALSPRKRRHRSLQLWFVTEAFLPPNH